MPATPLVRRLEIIAILVVLLTFGVWGATGAHHGWSKTEITEMRRDEITGLDYPVQHNGFVAGIDFLGAGLVVAGIVGTVAVVLRRS